MACEIIAYTKYGEIGTAILGRYQNSWPSSGTLDIKILSQVGHKSYFPYSLSLSHFICVNLIKSVLFYHKHTIEVIVIHNFMPCMGKIWVKKVGQELGH